MTWRVIAEDHHGWVLWNGSHHHTDLDGEVVIGTLETMHDLAVCLNQHPAFPVQTSNGLGGGSVP